MFVKEIKDIDKNSGEADVLVSDGRYEVMCYCHPLENKKQGAKVSEISTLFAEDIMRIDDAEYSVRKEAGHYSYYLQGKVIGTQKPLISIGKIIIRLDKPMAKDIKQGEFVQFKVERLNCTIE